MSPIKKTKKQSGGFKFRSSKAPKQRKAFSLNKGKAKYELKHKVYGNTQFMKTGLHKNIKGLENKRLALEQAKQKTGYNPLSKSQKVLGWFGQNTNSKLRKTETTLKEIAQKVLSENDKKLNMASLSKKLIAEKALKEKTYSNNLEAKIELAKTETSIKERQARFEELKKKQEQLKTHYQSVATQKPTEEMKIAKKKLEGEIAEDLNKLREHDIYTSSPPTIERLQQLSGKVFGSPSKGTRNWIAKTFAKSYKTISPDAAQNLFVEKERIEPKKETAKDIPDNGTEKKPRYDLRKTMYSPPLLTEAQYTEAKRVKDINNRHALEVKERNKEIEKNKRNKLELSLVSGQQLSLGQIKKAAKTAVQYNATKSKLSIEKQVQLTDIEKRLEKSSTSYADVKSEIEKLQLKPDIQKSILEKFKSDFKQKLVGLETKPVVAPVIPENPEQKVIRQASTEETPEPIREETPEPIREETPEPIRVPIQSPPPLPNDTKKLEMIAKKKEQQARTQAKINALSIDFHKVPISTHGYLNISENSNKSSNVSSRKVLEPIWNSAADASKRFVPIDIQTIQPTKSDKQPVWQGFKNKVTAVGTAIKQKVTGTGSVAAAQKVKNNTLGSLQYLKKVTDNITLREKKLSDRVSALAKYKPTQPITQITPTDQTAALPINIPQPTNTPKPKQNFLSKIITDYKQSRLEREIEKDKKKIAEGEAKIVGMITEAKTGKFASNLNNNTIIKLGSIQLPTTNNQSIAAKKIAMNALKEKAKQLESEKKAAYNTKKKLEFDEKQKLLSNPEALKEKLTEHQQKLNSQLRNITNAQTKKTKAQARLKTTTNSADIQIAKQEIIQADKNIKIAKEEYAKQQALNPTKDLLKLSQSTYNENANISSSGFSFKAGLFKDYDAKRAEQKSLQTAKNEEINVTEVMSHIQKRDAGIETEDRARLDKHAAAIRVATAKLASTSIEDRKAITNAFNDQMKLIETGDSAKAKIISNIIKKPGKLSDIRQTLTNQEKLAPKVVESLMKELEFRRLEKLKLPTTIQPVSQETTEHSSEVVRETGVRGKEGSDIKVEEESDIKEEESYIEEKDEEESNLGGGSIHSIKKVKKTKTKKSKTNKNHKNHKSKSRKHK